MVNTYIKVEKTLYFAQINGMLKNPDWDDRDTKEITLEMSYTKALEIFVDGLSWSIVVENDTDGVTEPVREEYDNSEYSLAGDITDHRDGTVTVIMGKPTELELAMELLLAERGMENV